MRRIYLDYNATSIMYPEVSEHIISLLKENIPLNASSIHQDGRKARSILEQARKKLVKSIGAEGDIDIIFTASGTEANNLAITNFKNIPMLAGSTEHVSIIEAGHNNIQLIPVDNDGLIDIKYFEQMLNETPGKKFISIMLANNETGVIQDIPTLSKIASANEAIFHCDASQAFGKIPFSFNQLGCDLMTISSHKCGGPLGSAALIAKKNLGLRPLILGGKQELGLRSGTENIIAISGFALAGEISLNKFNNIQLLRDRLESIICAEINSSKVSRLPNTSSIWMPNVKNEEQLIKFDLAGFSVSAGSACSSGRISTSHVLKAMGINEERANQTIRVSLGPSNTEEEIEKFAKLWLEIKNNAKRN